MPKKSIELIQKRTALEGKMEPLVLKAADELTPEERSTLGQYHAELKGLNEDIDLQEKNEQFEANRAARNGQTITTGDKKDISGYSFARAIRLLAEGKSVDGIEGEMMIEGNAERKALGIETKGFAVPMMVLRNTRASAGQNVTTAADGGNLVKEEDFIFIEALQNALVLSGLGIRILPGLIGNLPLLRGGSFSASWIAEGDAVTLTKESFSKVTMTPKNLVCAGAISRQLLLQTGGIAESLLRQDLIAAIARGLQDAAINGSGQNGQPTGILNTSGIGSVVGGTDGLAPTWANIVDLESKIDIANGMVGNMAYLTNSKVRGLLKTTLKATGVAGYIWEGATLNGYKTAVTNAVPSNLTKGNSTTKCSAIIAGVFSEMFMGMWGGLDLIVDPYTLATSGDIRVVNNQYADIALRNAASFAAMKDALTE